jgi:glycosyltransferase involved in cell wall biosynthesis
MKLSVIIPAYNEELIVRDTVRTLWDALNGMQNRGAFDDYELIFVSDGSHDATPNLVRQAEEQ